MRRLMLLRHAKSNWPDGFDDHERPLAERGRRASPMMGRYMAQQELLPDLAIVSTARRAHETWDLARRAFEEDIAQRDDARIYEASARTILDVIRETRPDVHVLLLVGHNPGLHELALKLIGKGSRFALRRLRRKYPTAGLVVIDFDIELWNDVSGGLGQIERFETPKSTDDSTEILP